MSVLSDLCIQALHVLLFLQAKPVQGAAEVSFGEGGGVPIIAVIAVVSGILPAP